MTNPFDYGFIEFIGHDYYRLSSNTKFDDPTYVAWRDVVSRALKIPIADGHVSTVLALHWTSLSEEQKIRIAAACHLIFTPRDK